MELTEQEIQDLYIWIDTAQYSRPKKSIARDFSDGGKVFKRIGYQTTAEIVQAIVNMRPGYVEYLLFELRIAMEEFQRSIGQNKSNNPGRVSKPEAQVQMPLEKSLNEYNNRQSTDWGQNATLNENSATERYSRTKPTNGVRNVPRTSENKPQEQITVGLPVEDMKDTIKVLQKKVLKLEELLRLKEQRILELSNQIN